MKKTIIKIFKRTMLTIVILAAALVAATWIFMRRPEFGKAPEGERLERIKRSKHYKDGQFQNLNPTPALTEGVSYYAVMKEFFFGRQKRKIPMDSLPSGKIDLHALDRGTNTMVWFGHSSYFIQLDGKRILVDPVLSGAASPVSFTTRSFRGSDVYTLDDIPDIDYLLISHDHWDHLDYKTITQLKDRVGKVICGLGVGAHFEHWGYDPAKVLESDWGDEIRLDAGFVVNVTPARHFSGRGFKRNGSLWVSYVLSTPGFRIYIGGDSGYDTHFREIGDKFGPFDLVMLECGQYDKSWKYIHMMPEQVVQAAIDLKAKKMMPVHWAKFSLGNHAWDDPILRVVNCGKVNKVSMITPMIGEEIHFQDTADYAAWWAAIR